MPKDVNLQLQVAETLTGSVTRAAKDTEGGFFATVRVVFGAITGTSPTDDMGIEAAIDGGTNYFNIAKFPQIIGTDDFLEIARPVYVPQPAAGQIVTKVRIKHTIAGTSPSFAIAGGGVFLEPLLSLGVSQVDEDADSGLAALRV